MLLNIIEREIKAVELYTARKSDEPLQNLRRSSP